MHQVPVQLKLAIFSPEVSRQPPCQMLFRVLGHRDALAWPRGSLTNLPALKEMRARLQGTELRLGGHGSSGQQIKLGFALSEKRRGSCAEGEQGKKRGEGYHNITILLINKSLLIACFWSHL